MYFTTVDRVIIDVTLFLYTPKQILQARNAQILQTLDSPVSAEGRKRMVTEVTINVHKGCIKVCHLKKKMNKINNHTKNNDGGGQC